jgi:hypothetical protein
VLFDFSLFIGQCNGVKAIGMMWSKKPHSIFFIWGSEMDGLSFYPTLTAQRRLILDRYLSENVLVGKHFICPFYKQCRDSHPDIFYEGQLHHVGNHYDGSIAGNPYRVMVVGQEYGHDPSLVSMDDRSQMVLEQTGIEKTFSNRNPHMRGTTSVLRLLFGIPLGGDHSEEFLHSPDGERFHLFDAFALVNYLLCSAVSADEGRRGKSRSIMRRNCLFHFRKAVEILEPTVMVVQGKSYWASIQAAFSRLNKISDVLYTAEINHQKVMIAVFAHPSTPDNKHNWGRDAKTPYLLEVVVPTITTIRKELSITSVSKGEFMTLPNSEPSNQPSSSRTQNQPYDIIFEQIQAGLIQRFPTQVTYRKPEFEHSTPNRMRIKLDRIKGSHYEICFRQGYYEFALHFESTPPMNLERRQAFDPHLHELTKHVGPLVKSGPLENKGRMRVWYEHNREPINQEKIMLYVDEYSRFIAATFPILAKVYDNSIK